MRDVRVIVSGCGGVGSNLVRLLAAKKGVEIAGVVDIAPSKVGQDAGIIAGGEPIGVIVTSDSEAL